MLTEDEFNKIKRMFEDKEKTCKSINDVKAYTKLNIQFAYTDGVGPELRLRTDINEGDSYMIAEFYLNMLEERLNNINMDLANHIEENFDDIPF